MRLDDHFWVIVTAVVAVLAVTRATRLVVDDDYPPIVWLRRWYIAHTDDRWGALVECPWCAAPYLAAPQVALLALLVHYPTWTALSWIWWIVNGWAALSWLAAYLTVRDIPPDQR